MLYYYLGGLCIVNAQNVLRDKNLVPRLTFKEQTGDNTLENICKCTENTVNKRKEEKMP